MTTKKLSDEVTVHILSALSHKFQFEEWKKNYTLYDLAMHSAENECPVDDSLVAEALQRRPTPIPKHILFHPDFQIDVMKTNKIFFIWYGNAPSWADVSKPY